MNNNTTVSVVIPTYNRAYLIVRAIQSVLKQTYQDFEIIVIDDGSTDNTEEVVKSINDKRIKYIKHEENKGVSTARNTGIKVAGGEYIAFLDSDDEWLPEKLKKQISFFGKCPDSFGAIYCLNYVKYDYSEYMQRVSLSNMRRGNVYNFLLDGWWCPYSVSLFVIARRVFERSGMFDENLPSFEDYDLWIRIARYYNFEFVDELLAIKHQHVTNLTINIELQIGGLKLLLDKWGDVIRKVAGRGAFNHIRRYRFFIIYQIAIFNNPSALALERFRALKYLIRQPIQFLSLRLLVKMVVILLGGPKLLHFCNGICDKLSQYL